MRRSPSSDNLLLPGADAAIDSGLNAAARATLDGTSRGPAALLPFIGPAFIASVAYIDPGNFATNIQGGSAFGYNLLWVIVLANAMAMLFQGLSAKLGIATGHNLAELCRDNFPHTVVIAMWIASEVAAMATDLAEFLGASLGLNLLLHVPLLPATLVTGVITYGILLLQRFGVRPLEAVITGLVAIIAVSYVVETFLSQPAWGQVAYHSLVPWASSDSVLLIVGIIGATVMPHVIYLHSALTQRRIVPRTAADAQRIFRFTVPEVLIALGLAGIINMAMLYMSAATFHARGMTGVADISTAYHTLTPLLGSAAGFVFAISLLASGLSSSTVGTMAGQVIMQGFVGFTIPVAVRRLATMAPAVIIAAIGVNPTTILVISQMVLSLILPVPLVALVHFTARRDIMGLLVNRRRTNLMAVAATIVIVVLNLAFLFVSLGGHVPGLA